MDFVNIESDIDDIELDFIENEIHENNEENQPERVPKRYIRDALNPFEFYDELQFKRRYRFSKESVEYGILPKIEQSLAQIINRGLPIPPRMQLLICLRFYATASFQVNRFDIKIALINYKCMDR